MTKKSRVIFYIVFTFIFILMAAIICIFIEQAKEDIQEETKQYIEEVGLLSAQLVEKQIANDIKTLKMSAIYIEQASVTEIATIKQFIQTEIQNYSFKRIGIINPQGKAYTSDEKILDLSFRDFFKKAMKGEANISKVLIDIVDGELINVQAVPIYQNNTVVAVLFGTQDINTYSDIINIETFNGAGYCYIVDKNGQFVVIPSKAALKNKTIQLLDNIITELEKTNVSADDYAKFTYDIQNNRNGVISYTLDGINKHMAYTKINKTDWYLLSVINSNIISAKTNALIAKFIGTAAVVFLLTILTLCGMILREYRTQKELEKLAFVDNVTGFSNWQKFKRNAISILKKTQTRYVIISFDVQNFKMYNDIYGHDKANTLLKNIAILIHNTCIEEETFCRISADNFITLSKNTGHMEIQNRIHTFLDSLHSIDGSNTFSCKFGIYEIDDNSLDINACCDKAYIAKLIAKKNTQSAIAYYDERVREQMIYERELEDIMQNSLEKGEFIMYLQPKVTIANGETIGAEALVRWVHPKQGIIPPIKFLPIFEQNGFITKIDFEICRQAASLIRKWIDEGKQPIAISVNFSRLHLHDPNFIETVNSIIDSYKIPHKYIEIEITETTIIDFENEDYLKKIIEQFQAGGYKVSMDDFGSGYSSLNMLSRLPVDVLKMDKRFFDDTQFNEDSRSIVAGVIRIAKELHMEIVAEGIEKQEQVDMLRNMNCDIIQGYYYAEPMPIREFEHFLFISGIFSVNV